jgi:ABC-type uncharacterized transport system auxiliary subunit
MKKALSLILALVLCLSLCACGSKNKPNGSYSAEIAGKTFATLTFSGNKVTYEGSNRTTSGTFTLDGNTVIISYENGNSDKLEYNIEEDTLSLAGLVFEKD